MQYDQLSYSQTEQDNLIFKVKLFWEKERKRERKYQLINWQSLTDLLKKSDWLTDKVWLTNWQSLID